MGVIRTQVADRVNSPFARLKNRSSKYNTKKEMKAKGVLKAQKTTNVVEESTTTLMR